MKHGITHDNMVYAPVETRWKGDGDAFRQSNNNFN